jgi:hypothetical protein
VGGRKPRKVNDVVGKSRQVTEQQQRLARAIKNKSAETTVGVAVGTLEASNPTIGTIVIAGKVLHLMCTFYEIYQKTYQRTGDEEKALKRAALRTVGRALTGGKYYVLESAMSYGWDVIKERSGIRPKSVINELIISAGVAALQEALE